MAEQERTGSTSDRRTDDAAESNSEPTTVDGELTDRIDDLLDEIDTVLEENAEEFVKNYVQKGGE